MKANKSTNPQMIHHIPSLIDSVREPVFTKTNMLVMMLKIKKYHTLYAVPRDFVFSSIVEPCSLTENICIIDTMGYMSTSQNNILNRRYPY